MGLDMYLMRYPRYKHYRPENIDELVMHINYENNADAQKYTFKKWCGGVKKLLPGKRDSDYLKQFMTTRYYAWDDEHKYPHEGIADEVAYWRKANAVHKWFVDNIQDGEDDCRYHREVTEDDLIKLIDACKTILDNAILKEGKIQNGYRWTLEGGEEPIYEDGKYVVNPEVCEEWLPTGRGFFFGSTDYNQWYISDIEYTYETLKKVLEETDFEKQMLFYVSSW